MNLTIISCSPRIVKNSNTDKILSKFKAGFERNGNTTQTFYLSEKSKWSEIREAFYESDNILFGIPLFVECIPGIMLEFFESLAPKTYENGKARTRLSFLVQSGFEEASQLRCCEHYLEKLPSYFNCDYAGTLIRGGMFAVSFVPTQLSDKMINRFTEMGRIFAEENKFEKAKVTKFAKPEYYSKGAILKFKLVKPFNQLFFILWAKSLGCKGSLKSKPYKKYVK